MISDALRRHYGSCSQVGIQPKPGPSKPGRRRKACDNCAKNRITCDASSSCGACQAHGLNCTYRRLQPHLNVLPLVSPSAASGGVTGVGSIQQGTQEDERRPEKISVPFLLNYSSQTNRNLGDVNHVFSSLLATESSDQSLDSALPSLDVEVDRADLFFEDSWDMFFESFTNNVHFRNSPLPGGMDDSEQRKSAATRMIDCLSKVCSTHAKSWEAFNTGQLQEFFQEENMSDFIKAYFDHTVRPRSRIVLKSSFDLETISTPLLLSMFLMGATCSGSESAKSQSIEYADMVEFAVFDNPVFVQLQYRKRTPNCDCMEKDEIEIIQAAILIILIQLSNPKAETRRRIQIQQYPALVSVARATSLTEVKSNWHEANNALSHDEFLKNETCIRLACRFSNDRYHTKY